MHLKTSWREEMKEESKKPYHIIALEELIKTHKHYADIIEEPKIKLEGIRAEIKKLMDENNMENYQCEDGQAKITESCRKNYDTQKVKDHLKYSNNCGYIISTVDTVSMKLNKKLMNHVDTLAEKTYVKVLKVK